MLFEWDPKKAGANFAKHGTTFEEASEIFGDPLAVSINDPDHSTVEDRFVSTGVSRRGQLLVVSHVYRSGRIRI
ncbi:MAG TPA: BrnT family toxin, partial [Pyrinomonadaceae bacterium]|nr:BrnT family toxin [Pyrinomonadaceae bacterium]